MYYINKDGSYHHREGDWIDNDLRGLVKHVYPAENRTVEEFWNYVGFYVGKNYVKPVKH